MAGAIRRTAASNISYWDARGRRRRGPSDCGTAPYGPEEQGAQPILDEIRRRFDDEVANLVDGLIDTMEDPKPKWRPRKEAYLARLKDEPISVLRVSLADKLHNLRSVAVDLEESGAAVWKRFNAGRKQQEWYYCALLEVFERRLPDSRHLPEFRRLVGEVFDESGTSARL